jgi:hypothetical protein
MRDRHVTVRIPMDDGYEVRLCPNYESIVTFKQVFTVLYLC